MATTGDAQRITLLAGATAASLTTAARLITGGIPTVKIWLGAGVAVAVGLAAAEGAPDLVARFATLVLLTSLFTAGGTVAPKMAQLVS